MNVGHSLMGVLLCTLWFSAVAASAAEVEEPAGGILGAVGIGVSDLARSQDFYTRILGMEKLRAYDLDNIEEIVLGFPDEAPAAQRGPVIVLMKWRDGKTRNFSEDNVKLVFYVADPVALIERIRQFGGRIDREATPIDVLPGQIVGLARDPDNYVIEVLKRLPD